MIERCSFCGKSKFEAEGKRLVRGLRGYICKKCVMWAAQTKTHVAYCAHCITTDDGQHAADCTERDIA